MATSAVSGFLPRRKQSLGPTTYGAGAGTGSSASSTGSETIIVGHPQPPPHKPHALHLPSNMMNSFTPNSAGAPPLSAGAGAAPFAAALAAAGGGTGAHSPMVGTPASAYSSSSSFPFGNGSAGAGAPGVNSNNSSSSAIAVNSSMMAPHLLHRTNSEMAREGSLGGSTLVNGNASTSSFAATHGPHAAHLYSATSGSSTPANASNLSLGGLSLTQSAMQAPSSSSADGGIGASLIHSGAPQAANVMSNKQAGAGTSLYQSCLILRDRLWRVQGFGERFLLQQDASVGAAGTGAGTEQDGAAGSAGHNTASTEASPIRDGFSSAPASPKVKPVKAAPSKASDPVTQLWQCFRLGAPLCWMFNKLGPKTELPTSIPTPVPSAASPASANGTIRSPDGISTPTTPAPAVSRNECKKLVAKFIMALKLELDFQTEEIFTISQLYLNDTNGFVRVVRTISKLLDVFDERGMLVASEKPEDLDSQEEAEPGDDRARVVRELLDTERKYVMHLETLQSFAKALGQNAILPPDTIHNLFGNLDTMVDVQRRFLICVEENARLPVDDQHFGHVFKAMEPDFTVYEPFCANYAQALDIVVAEAPSIQRFKGMPGSEDCFLEPAYELPAFLIKPVQRICKYHLILEQLIKRSSPDAPYMEELRQGYQIIKAVADRVNETRRLQENAQIVQELSQRVEDWKGHNIQTFGHLLLSDVFMVAKGDTEREYHVYLFEKILLCCKEVLPSVGKKQSKSNSLLKQKNGVPPPLAGKKAKTTLLLKGRIFINNVTGAASPNKASSLMGMPAGPHSLQVWWRGDFDQESFSLRCKNEEQLKQWQNALNKLIEDVHARRQQLAAQYAGGAPSPTANFSAHGMLARRMTGPQSQFPQTPINEQGGFFPLTRADSKRTEDAGQTDDDQVEGLREGVPSGFSGRGTPGMTRMAQSADLRDRQLSFGNSEAHQPRAATEDQDSATLSQWRSQQPPPIPRNNSMDSNSSQTHNLRRPTSTKHLRQQAPLPKPPHTAQEMSSNEALNRQYREDEARNRNRSASNPHAFHLPASMQHLGSLPQQPRLPPKGQEPQVPQRTASSRQHAHLSEDQDGPSMLGYLSDRKDALKRVSASSHSTVDSVRSARSRPESTAASSPVTRSTSSSGGSQPRQSAGAGNAVRIIVHSGTDRYTVAVLASVTYEELAHKVATKVRIVAGRNVVSEGGIRLRYIDEDGDRIMMKNDDDVQMAFEAARSAGGDVQLVVS